MRNRYILLGDLILVALAAYGAFALRFDWLFYEYRAEFVPFLVVAELVPARGGTAAERAARRSRSGNPAYRQHRGA